MAISARTLDEARYIDVYAQTKTVGLKKLPFSFVDIDGQNYISVEGVTHDGSVLASDFPRNVVGTQVMPHLPWPLEAHQPAPTSDNGGEGPFAVHFFSGF